MPLALLGIGCGVISGAATYAYTGAGQISAAVGIVAAVLTWLGIATLAIFDD
ncbi:hypothetical protein AB0886_05320 [Streptomyces sp. NPDC024062]|uniref:hypothetical protein n=1 Tax=unclassified Streptomyces TaxID=2593676 RepID=UPI00341CC4CD